MRRDRVVVGLSCLLSLVLSLNVAAGPLCPDGIGIYCDTNPTHGSNRCYPSLYATVNLYVVATNISEESGVSGWEGRVYFDPAPRTAVTYALQGPGALNVLPPPEFQVGMSQPGLPYSSAMHLMTISFLYFGGCMNVGLGPITSVESSLPDVPVYATGDDPERLVPFQVASTVAPILGAPGAYWVATINCTENRVLDCGGYNPISTVVSVGDVQRYTAEGRPDSPFENRYVYLHGALSSPTDRFGDGLTYFQDETGGIAVVCSSLVHRQLGDSLSFEGRVTSCDGEIVLKEFEGVTIAYKREPLPTILTVGQALDYEQVGRLTNVYGRILSPRAGGFDLVAGDAVLPVRIAAATNIDVASLAEGDMYSITGILRVSLREIQLWPRRPRDMARIGSPYSFLIGVAAQIGDYQDESNIFGAVEGATDGFDSGLDVPEPPAVPAGFVRAFFAHPEWALPVGEAFAKDLQAGYDLNLDRKVWPFSVITDQVGQVALKFSPSFGANMDFDIVVEDPATGDLDFLAPPYEYRFDSDGHRRRDFHLYVGRYHPVPAVTPAARDVAAGWSILALPLVPASGQGTVGASILDDVAGTAWLFDYKGPDGYAPLGATSPLAPGEAVWIGNLEPFVWDMDGWRDFGVVDVPVSTGWNLHGFPLWFTFPLEAAQVVHGGAAYEYRDAVAANLVASAVYDWDTGSSLYRPVSELEAWRGYWLAAYADDVTIRYDYRRYYEWLENQPQPIATASMSAEGWASGWRLDLRLMDTGQTRAWATLGSARGATDEFDAAFDLPAPPSSPQGQVPTLTFQRGDWRVPTGAAFTTDIRSVESRQQQWRVKVTVPQPCPATLTWNAEAIPEDADASLTLTNPAQVLVPSMRAQQSLSLAVPWEGLDIEVVACRREPDSPPERLDAVGLRAVPNPFNPGTDLKFALLSDGIAELRIYDARGRLVRTLAGDRMPAGEHVARWDGLDARDSSLPSGLYCCRLYVDGNPIGRRAKLCLVK